MYFREIVLKLTIDVEHFLKVQILSKSNTEEKDDGYAVVEQLLLDNPDVLLKIESHSKNGYHSELIQRYTPTFPLWVFLEIISFGDLIQFYNFYTKRFSIENNVSQYLWSARILRNAAAHNSCILNRITEKFSADKVNSSLMNVLKRRYTKLNPSRLKTYLQNPVIQDFIDVLILYNKLTKTKVLLKKRIEEIDTFFIRCRKNATYYKQNQKLRDAFVFVYQFFQEYKSNI